jgi:hypothetical protein
MDIDLDPDPGDPVIMDWNQDYNKVTTETERNLLQKVTENREFRPLLQRENVKPDDRSRKLFNKPNEIWNFDRKDALTGKFVRIKSIIDGELEKINPIVMDKWLKQVVPNHSDCRRTREGELILLSNVDRQTTRFVKMNRIQTEPNKHVELKIELIDSMNRSKGTIFGSDLLRIPEDGPDGLKKCFEDQGIVEYVALPTRTKDGQQGLNGLYVLTFDQRQPPDDVKVGYMKYTVKPWIPSPLKCQKCLKFGHTKNRCSDPKDLCRGCVKTKHDGQCAETKCYHCESPKEEHQTFSNLCPVMKKEKRICQLKTEMSISFAKARDLVEKENNMNFAAALRVGGQINEQEIQSIENQSSAAQKTLEELQQKVKKLQEQQRLIQLYKEKAESLAAQNLELTQKLGLDISQFEQYDSQIDDEQCSSASVYNERQLRSKTTTPGPKKPQPFTSTPIIQKRNAEENKLKNDKKPKNSDITSPSMQIPKKLTADMITRFDVDSMKQLNQFRANHPNSETYFIRGQDGRFTFVAPVFQTK